MMYLVEGKNNHYKTEIITKKMWPCDCGSWRPQYREAGTPKACCCYSQSITFSRQRIYVVPITNYNCGTWWLCQIFLAAMSN